jgi:hypothetical protein
MLFLFLQNYLDAGHRFEVRRRGMNLSSWSQDTPKETNRDKVLRDEVPSEKRGVEGALHFVAGMYRSDGSRRMTYSQVVNGP